MRLATWNLLHGRSPSGEVGRDALHAAVQQLDADALAIQEVDRAQQRSHHRDLTEEVAAAMGAEAWRFVPALIGSPTLHFRVADDADLVGHDLPGTGQDQDPAYGVGLLSRLPVRVWHTLRLTAGPVRLPTGREGRRVLWSGDEPRVAVAAEMDTDVGPLTVATTHVSFLPLQSAVHLRRVARWLVGLPGPHVLLGDLNMPPSMATKVSGMRPLVRAPTFPAPAPRVQLDHVLGRGTLPAPRNPRAWHLPVSDHRALSVDLG